MGPHSTCTSQSSESKVRGQKQKVAVLNTKDMIALASRAGNITAVCALKLGNPSPSLGRTISISTEYLSARSRS